LFSETDWFARFVSAQRENDLNVWGGHPRIACTLTCSMMGAGVEPKCSESSNQPAFRMRSAGTIVLLNLQLKISVLSVLTGAILRQKVVRRTVAFMQKCEVFRFKMRTFRWIKDTIEIPVRVGTQE